MAVNFVPASTVTHIDDSRRQLEFTQRNNGEVSVRVHFGLKNINMLFQDMVFIERNVIGLQPIGDATLANLTPEERKNILNAINNTAEIRTEDGRMTDLKKRNSDGFFHEVRSVTIILN